MVFDGKTSYLNLQYYINRAEANISPLPSGKVDKYEYLTRWRNATPTTA